MIFFVCVRTCSDTHHLYFFCLVILVLILLVNWTSTNMGPLNDYVKHLRECWCNACCKTSNVKDGWGLIILLWLLLIFVLWTTGVQVAMDHSASALRRLARRHGCHAVTHASTALTCLHTAAMNSSVRNWHMPSKKQKALDKNSHLSTGSAEQSYDFHRILVFHSFLTTVLHTVVQLVIGQVLLVVVIVSVDSLIGCYLQHLYLYACTDLCLLFCILHYYAGAC